MTSASPPAELLRVVRSRNGRSEGAEIRFRCPHPDQHRNGDATPSARYHPERHVWHCDACGAGGGWVELCRLLDVALPHNRSSSRSQVTASYEYRDESGAILRRKLRWEPGFKDRSKSFTWERPDGVEGWTRCKGDGNPQTLYHSERLPAARQACQRVLVVEGEKDADRANPLGFVAVCNPEGAGTGKWKDDYSDQLRDLAVVVIVDRDEPGRVHAACVAESLHGTAESVRVLELPGEVVKDLSDWVADKEHEGLEATAITAELEALLDAAPSNEGEIFAEPDALASALQALAQLGESPELTEIEAPLRELAEAVTRLDPLDCELARESAVQALTGKVKAPGRLVDAAFKQVVREASDTLQGRALALEDPDPWPEPVEGAGLLADIESTFQRFVVLPEGASCALALWVLHTYAHEAAYISPLLALTSPEKRCGKTTLVSLLNALVRRPLPASNITAAALFRAVEKYSPTLLIDEADTFLREREELRGILNSGHTRQTAFVVRTAGDEHEPRCFSTWSPKAIALIGKLPSTLEDRSIPVAMKRKAPGESVERLRLDRLGELSDLRSRALRWALDREPMLRSADPDVPPALHDRAADNWRPLLAIADDAGGTWPARARRAALQLSNQDDGDSSERVQLLADIQVAFQSRNVDRLFTERLLSDLTSNEGRPWGEWRRGKPLSSTGLARLLKPFGLTPRKLRIGEETRQGYRLEDFTDALARYLPATLGQGSNPEHPEQLNNDGALLGIPTRNNVPSVPGWIEPENPATTGVVPGVPAQLGGTSEDGDADREIFDL